LNRVHADSAKDPKALKKEFCGIFRGDIGGGKKILGSGDRSRTGHSYRKLKRIGGIQPERKKPYDYENRGGRNPKGGGKEKIGMTIPPEPFHLERERVCPQQKKLGIWTKKDVIGGQVGDEM